VGVPAETSTWGESQLRRARIAVSICFFVLGAGTGVWAVHIPLVQARLGIDTAVLGLALFALAIGAVGTMPITGIALSRFGSRLPTQVLSIAFPVVFPLAILAPTTPLLFASLFLFVRRSAGSTSP
jgi:MFS family permease